MRVQYMCLLQVCHRCVCVVTWRFTHRPADTDAATAAGVVVLAPVAGGVEEGGVEVGGRPSPSTVARAITGGCQHRE